MERKWYKKWWGVIIIILIILFLSFLILFSFYFSRFYKKVQSGELISKKYEGKYLEKFTNSGLILPPGKQSKPNKIVETLDDPFAGSPEAKVTIVEFGDFECPFCRDAYPVVRELINYYGNKIKFIYRDYPVSQAHPRAQKAAEAGECADDQGKFWAIHDKMFQNQEHLEIEDLKLYAQQIGLDLKKFNLCLDSGQYSEEVKDDFMAGLKAEVKGTPTFFINREKVEGALPLKVFKQIIDSLL